MRRNYKRACLLSLGLAFLGLTLVAPAQADDDAAMSGMAAIVKGALGINTPTSVGNNAFRDVLDTPALQTPLAQRSPMLAVASWGRQIIAVGVRGQILFSADGGANWRQASVPASSDLTCVTLVNENLGFAAGHDGIILRTDNGGASWVKLTDGRVLMPQIARDLAEKIAAHNVAPVSRARVERLQREAQRDATEGANKPFLSIWFKNAEEGFVVGAYNLIFHTTDGGKTWVSWFDRTDNPKFYHFNTIRGVGAALYLAGEQGMVLRYDAASGQFLAMNAPYGGSFFDLALSGDTLLAVGMRGAIWRHAKGRWSPVVADIRGGISGVTQLTNGRFALSSQSGQVLISSEDGQSFTPLTVTKPMTWTSVSSVGTDKLALTGVAGVRVVSLQK